jgi:hypothetical protein
MATNINYQNETILTRDQRFLLNTYLSMYNSTLRQIDSLHSNLDEIRDSINLIVSASMRPHSRRRNRNVETEETNNNIIPPSQESSRSRQPLRSSRTTREIPPLRPPTPSPLSREEIFEFTFVPGDSQRLSNELQNLMRNFYNPIPVAPSLEQINTATTDILFLDIEEPVNSSCPITLERFTDQQMVCKINHCGHIFNREQLFAWFVNNVRCPVCRYDIRGDTNTQQETRANVDSSQNLLSNITSLLMSELLTGEQDASNNPFSLLNNLLQFPNTTSSYSYTRR